MQETNLLIGKKGRMYSWKEKNLVDYKLIEQWCF